MDKPRADPKDGRGKPSRTTQFQPGQSGNPRGRPKIDNDIASALHSIMDLKIPIMVAGKQRMVTGSLAITFRRAAIQTGDAAQGGLSGAMFKGPSPRNSEGSR